MRSPASRPSVLVVDDHPGVRSALRANLAADGRFGATYEVGNGADAIDLAWRLHPGIVLLEVRLGPPTGLQTLALVRRNSPRSTIIVMSASPQVHCLARGDLDLSDGVVVKGDATAALLDRVWETYLSGPAGR